MRIGIIGLSVHSAAFTEIVNSANGNSIFAECKVVALYEPPVKKDVEFTRKQILDFTSTVKRYGVELVNSMNLLLKKSDVIMILTNDGRPHLEEVLTVLKSGRYVFVDKPLSNTFQGVMAIFKISEKYDIPIFTSSPLRFGDGFQADVRTGKFGKVLGGETYGPAPIQKSHVDLFWDGIHGVELLYSIMGRGCQSIQRVAKENEDIVFGVWEDGRIGAFRGIRQGKAGFGGRVFGSNGIATMNAFEGYRPLLVEVINFFKTGIPPVKIAETIELYAFMEAAKRSRELNGEWIDIGKVLQ